MELRELYRLVEVPFGDLNVDWKRKNINVQDQLCGDLDCRVIQRINFLGSIFSQSKNVSKFFRVKAVFNFKD